MSYKIGIIGFGNVGVSYAYSLINQGIDVYELDVIDLDKEAAKGKIIDLVNSSIYSRSYINEIKIADYNDLDDADIICITAGMPQSRKIESRMDDIKGATKIVEDIMNNIIKTKFSGIILVATNPLDVITFKVAKMYKNYSKVIGTGTMLDTTRLRCEIANKLGFPLKSISGYVFGEHGNSQFCAWSSVKINNTYSIDDYLTVKEKLDIEEKVKQLGPEIAKLQGYTCYGIANVLSRITSAIINDETNLLFSLCSYDSENDIYISSLTRIGKEGVIENNLYELSKKEKELYNNSCKVVKEENVL